jgi:DNA polymerase-3 subunit delta'
VSAGPPAPAANPALLGHDRPERAWLTAWRAGRLPHAWLLTGPRGVGKATLAFRLTRAYLAGREAEPGWHDPALPTFRMVSNLAHPDLVVLEPRVSKAGNATMQKVEVVRVTLEGLYRTSTAGRRVCLIDEADTTLNEEGENALLKVLEEPPPGLVFLLVAQRPGRLLRTIPSRCTALRLAPLTTPEVEAGLRLLDPALPEGELPRLAELAEGSIGRAFASRALDWEGAYAALLAAFAEARDEGGRLRAVAALYHQVEATGARDVAAFMAVLLRRVARVRAGRPPALELCEGESERLAALARSAALDRWLALWDKLAALSERVEAVNLDPLQALLQVAHGVCGGEAEPAAIPPGPA